MDADDLAVDTRLDRDARHVVTLRAIKNHRGFLLTAFATSTATVR